MKSKFLIIGLTIFILLFLSASSLLISDNNQPKWEEDYIHLVIRSIGDKILRQAGDSTSIVLPVTNLDKHTFQIEFQQAFSFVPDSIVKLIHNNLKINKLPLEYRVKVLDCNKETIVYGYEIKTEKNDLIPCLGRTQTKACYKIQITFLENHHLSNWSHPYLWLIGLSNLFLLGLLIQKYRKNDSNPQTEMAGDFIPLGKYAFYVNQKILKHKTEIIELSDKESNLLQLFCQHLNETITRDTLIKEIWENEGVFVGGRTLDVFVSKLRKKLQNDKSLKINNIHSKDYKLEVISVVIS